MIKPEQWLRVLPQGLYCVPADLYVDPVRPVARAVVTHGHGDHARPGNGSVLATAETLAIMRARFGAVSIGQTQALAYGQEIELTGVRLRLLPAGHVLGSAQVVLEHGGCRVVVSGDYKRRRDPTCVAFEPVATDLFITEATFALPVFRHPPDAGEIAKLLHSVTLFPERSHLVGVYALGKAQRVMTLLREGGWDGPIWCHGALAGITEVYQSFGQTFGDLRPVTAAGRDDLKGAIVLAPPSAEQDRWSRRLAEPLSAVASGWMGVRARARQRGAELPLVISDHADWDELVQTVTDMQAPSLWVTHGNEEALVHFARTRGIDARALSLVGYEEEE
jgi:putative mRNA 3-end processing factor